MKKPSNLRRLLVASLVASLFPGQAWAAPQGPQVVSGQATVTRQGALTSITNTPGAILNWQSFSIGAGETTRFVQQSASSTVLNRVVGQDPSQILGSLQSNGRVFLVNPNGIVFGAGSRVDVGGLVAATLALSNEDFLAGRLNFRAGDQAGAIVNQGSITTPAGGRVYIVAPDIQNSGVITTPQGATLLAAGRQVSLVDAASPYVDVIVSAPVDRALNVGEIVAHGGSIGIYGALINQRGRLDADSMVVGENGRIVLKATGDVLVEAGSRTTARGAGKGGEIQVLGDRVALTGDAKLDASGQLGGGTVLVGGDYQGKNPAIQNAQQTYIGADAEIRVDALESGDGGKAIAWSDGLTRVHGFISARGGEQAGNGGFVETSGKTLDMQGRVDTRAPHGRTGTLLLDPANIYIAASQASATAADMSSTDTSASTGPSPFGPSDLAFDSLLTTATLAAALESSSVVVSTDIGGSGSSGFIHVVDSFAWSAPNSLTLNASGSVFGNGTISGASLVVNANGGINLRTQVASLAAVDMGNDSGMTFVNTGNLILQNIAQSGSHGMGISITNNGGGLFVLAGSTISASGPTGNVTLTSAAGISQGGTITAGGSVTLNGPTIAPSVLLTTPAAEPVRQVINTTVNTINTVIANAAQPTKPVGPPAPSVDAMRAAEAAARAAADAAAKAAADAVAIAVADAAANAAAAAATAAAMRAAAKAAEVAAEAMAAAQAAAKVAADVAANAAAYEAAQVAKATQLAASALTDSATVAKAAADAAAKAAADTAAMKAKADADAQAALNAAVRAKSDADAKAAAAEKAEADAKKDDKKDDAKKDDKKEVAATDKSGAKKEDAAKKMYCN